MRSSIKAAIAGISLLSVVSLTACASGVTGTAAAGAAAPTSSKSTSSKTTSSKTTESKTTSSASSSSETASETAAPSTTSAIPPTSTPSPETNSDATATIDDDTLSSGVTIDELVDDMYGAQEVVNTFWATHWSDYYTGSYQPPTVRGLYDGTDPADTPSCDGVPLQVDNAYYCESEDYVAWDASLLVEGADQIGDSWVYLVVAREWAQAMQARLDPSLLATGEQLQADCLAAAAIFGAQADGTLELEPGDENELIGSLTALADSSPWTSSTDHGDSFERVQWFTLGRSGGVNACHDVLAPADAAPTTA
jgi:hypothetical protein